MKKVCIIIIASCLTLGGYAQNPALEWVKQIGGATAVTSITTDASGNIYTTGYFTGTTDFDPGSDVFNLTAVGEDIFIQKLDANGNFIWAKKMGSVYDDRGHSITTDADGNVYTTGFFRDLADFDPGPDIYNLTAVGEDIFILKLDADGNFIWAKDMGASNHDQGASITTDANGNVYTTGHFWGTADFKPGQGVYHLTATYSDAFIQKLNANGDFLWAKKVGGNYYDSGDVIATDANRNIYLAGRFTETVDFDPGSGIYNLTATIDGDAFIQKLDDNGNFLWAKQLEGSIISMTIDADDNVYTTGRFNQTVDFDPGVGVYNLTSVGDGDIFIQKLDTNGNFIWVKQMGADGHDRGNSIATDASGNVYTTGRFEGTVDFNPGLGVQNLTSTGDHDIFIQKLNTNGNLLWVEKIGGSAYDSGNSIATDANGNVHTTGSFRETVDFAPGVDVQNLTSIGSPDAFIQKLNQCIPTGIDMVTTCDTYTWIDGNTYTESNNTATFNIAGGAANGCDSLVTLDLTITSVMGIDTQTACDSYTWIDGNTYTESNNTATFNIAGGAANGCDSLVTLDLTINKVSDITIFINGSTISANNSNAIYQWLDCDNNNTPISGATNQDFTATMNGNYAVELTENGCTDTSACVLITTVNLIENISADKFVLSPNPTTADFAIQFDDIQQNLNVRLFSVSGQLIIDKNFQNTNLIPLKIKHPTGVYLLEIVDSRGNKTTLKVMKQ